VPKGTPVILDTKSFQTKKQALAYFKAMLARYVPEEIVDDADMAHLNALLKRHPEAAEKIGLGVHHFEVMSAEYGTNCFGVVRRDGTRIDFSYVVCVTNETTASHPRLGLSP